MLIETLNELWLKRWVRVVTWLIIVFLVGLLIFTIFNRKNYKDFGPFTTPFSSEQNFSQMQGNSVYSYNGLAFYKLDLGNNQTSVLNTGSRFPTPDQVVWAGDQGALLNFSGPLYSTRIETALQARGESVNKATQMYTWYLDFATNELKMVSKYSIRKGLAAYSTEAKGVYYVPNYGIFLNEFPETEENLNRLSLNFYGIESGVENEVAGDLKAVDATSVFLCANQAACVITVPSQQTTKTSVSSFTKSGETQVLLENFDGRVFSTNSPNLVITVPNRLGDLEDAQAKEGDSAEGQAVLYDLGTKKSHDLGFSVGNSSLLSNFNGRDFYIFDTNQFSTPGKPQHFYRVGVLSKNGKPSTKLVDITGQDEAKSKTGVYLDVASYGTEGRSLLTPIAGNMVLFGEVGKAENISSVGSDEAKASVAQCQADGKPELQYYDTAKQFRILLPQTANWQTELANFSTCLSEKALSAMVGYNYQFSLTDPVNGRLVSD